MSAIVSFHDVAKRYRRGQERVNLRAAIPGRFGESASGEVHWALDGLSFELEAGQSLGLIGPNGAGKSTTLKLVAKVIAPTRGEVHIRGRAASLIELGAGFHPDMTGRENVYFGAAVLGMGPRSLRERFDEIVAFADIGAYLDTPVKRYSSGMMARLGFAVASHLDADVLVLDEVLAVGDAAFQRKCHTRIAELRQGGSALLYVTHALWTVPLLCERAILLAGGTVRAEGAPSDVLRSYERMQQEGSPPTGDTTTRLIRSVRASVGSIEPGGHVDLDIELDLPEAYPSGQVLVILADPEERVIAVTSSLTVAPLSQGRTHLRCSLGALPLQPGSYQLHVGLMGDHSMPAVDEMRTLALAVTGTQPEQGHGALKLASSWSHLDTA